MKQIALLIFSLCTCSAQAQLIGVQFFTAQTTDNPAALSSNAVAGVIPQDNFNVVPIDNTNGTGDFSASNLLTSTGLGSGVSIAVTNDSDSNYTGTTISSAAGTPNAILLSSQAGDWENPSPTFTFSGLAPGEYDLVIYTVGNGNILDEVSLTEGTASTPNYFVYTQNGSDFDGTFIQSAATTAGGATTPANYVEFLDVSPNSSGNIQFQTPTGVNQYNWAPVSALQLEAVPEPPALLLMSLGALLLPILGCARRFVVSS